MDHTKNNLIELRPYLPAPELPSRTVSRRGKDTLPWFAALIESVVTIGIGVCFALGLIVSLLMAL